MNLSLLACVIFALNTVQIQASAGMALNMVTSVMPPELRGATGTLANIAMADANKKKGLIEFIQDGSDYGYVCLCPTKEQIANLQKAGKVAAADKCAEDQKMGCRASQSK